MFACTGGPPIRTQFTDRTSNKSHFKDGQESNTQFDFSFPENDRDLVKEHLLCKGCLPILFPT